MKTSYSRLNKITAVLVLYVFAIPTFAIGADTKTAKKPLTEEQKIAHVLNRLGFGARPGDVERVKSVGLQKYIDQQLNGASIDDSVAESKVKRLEIFQMSTAEVFAKYP